MNVEDELRTLRESDASLRGRIQDLRNDLHTLLDHLELAFEDIPEKRVVKSTAGDRPTT